VQVAGHSKWSQIKRKKAVNDQKRGKVISKHVRAIQSAVREGGSGDPATNLGLKNALAAAKTDDVTADNIERAIERAVGSADGASFETVFYEGYGPVGVAVLVEALTDNRNRTASEVRHVFSKHGGNMSGGTAWQFESKGVIVVDAVSDELQEAAIDLGAEDLELDDGGLTITTAPTDLHAVVDGLQARGFEPSISQLTRVAQNVTEIGPGDARKVLGFIEHLEDLDDVQNVYSTADLEDEELVNQE
jgi:YebC/PmpR family DNA-binding regulatory protein